MDGSNWIDVQKKRLNSQVLIGYAAGEPICAEPVAVAALTACGYRLLPAAKTACQCLRQAQNADGSISVRLDADGPFWSTSLACIAWRQLAQLVPSESAAPYRDAYRRAIDFLLGQAGEKIDPSDAVGHNTQLVGWPWVKGTHSWLEPTAFAFLALRHCGFGEHPRALEAAALILDRLLEEGGANYGNTRVLGQTLRPHVLPSGLCMVALHRVQPRMARQLASYAYLRQQLEHPMAAASLAWTVQALVSENWDAAEFDPDAFHLPLKVAVERVIRTDGTAHRLNLLMLAALMRQSPVLDMPALRLNSVVESTP